MKGPRFLHHAQAVGVAGRITRPFEELIEGQAPSALTPWGGYSSNRKTGFRVREVISYGATYTETAGSFNERDDAHETVATATVEDFNLAGVVTAELILGRVNSSHPATRDDEPSITPQGSTFRGLRIAGYDIELESLVDEYTTLSTMKKLREHYRDNDKFRETFERGTFVGKKDAIQDEKKHKYFPWCRHQRSKQLPEHRGGTIVPLFLIKNPSAPGFDVHGNVVYIKDFGRVQIGELVIKSHERRLTMLRADLGSPIEGTFDAASVVGNGGHTDPP